MIATLAGRPNERHALIKNAVRLERLTVAWLMIEAAVALGSGLAAHSTTLSAFGFDSVIELASACLLLWRLSVELRRGREFSADAEILASRTGAGLLFALALYVVASAVFSLWMRQGAAFSLPGFGIALAAMPIMSVLSRRKLIVADRLGSRALRTDAAESMTCVWLSAVVVIGLLAQLLAAQWWVDAATSLGIVWFLVKEGREAFEDAARRDDCD